MHNPHSYQMFTAGNKNEACDNEDEEIIPLMFPMQTAAKQKYQMFDTTYSATHTHVYISKGIDEPHEYIPLIHRLNTASAADTVFIHLNTPGGNLDTGVQLINAMRNSDAHVVTLLEGTVCSLGTFIFLAGDELVVNDRCMMMFHNFRSGLIGKGQELAAELKATVAWYEAFAKDLYSPFLTKLELDRIMKGEDIWMHTPEIRKRLNAIAKEAEMKTVKERKPKIKPTEPLVVETLVDPDTGSTYQVEE